MEQDAPMNIVINRLKEREKELKCMYQVEEHLKNDTASLEEVFSSLVKIIPYGWQYPGVCEVRIQYEHIVVESEGFRETEWMQRVDLVIDNNISGSITVCYTMFIRLHHDSQFLADEQKLLQLIAERISAHIFFRKLKISIDFLKAYAENGKITGNLYPLLSSSGDMHWKWRLRMALAIAEKTDLEKFGVKAFYVIGSTKDATSGPASDLDLLLHFVGDENQRLLLETWIEGWSYSLAEFNYAQTGYRVEKMIDLHLVTNEDIKKQNSFASMIGSTSSSAMLLRHV